jgi:hypothetical protein
VALDYFAPAIEHDAQSQSVFFPIGGSVDSGFHVFDASTGQRRNARLISTSGSPTDLVLIQVVPESTCIVPVLLLALGLRSRVQRPSER